MRLLNKLFNEKEDVNFILSPADGAVIPMTHLNDPIFASKMLGDGIAVVPTNGKILSPVAGTISLIFDTKHAIAITTKSGMELIVHVGLDTASLGGVPYELLVEKGQEVNSQDVLMKVDLQKIIDAGKDTVIAVIITKDLGRTLTQVTEGNVAAGTPIMRISI